jgi:hypothetical protein
MPAAQPNIVSIPAATPTPPGCLGPAGQPLLPNAAALLVEGKSGRPKTMVIVHNLDC